MTTYSVTTAYFTEAKDLLRRAQANTHNYTVETLEGARELLSSAEEVIVRHVDDVLLEATQRLDDFDGLPVSFNPMLILGAEESERSHQAVYAWLLDPEGDHGLGDGMVRRLIWRCVGPAWRQRLLDPRPIQARVFREVQLRAGRLDVLVVASQLVIGVELKVNDKEHAIEDGGYSFWQTRYYRELLERPTLRWDVLTRLGVEVAELAGAAPRVVMALLRRQGADEAQDRRSLTLSWLEVDADLVSTMRRSDVSPHVMPFLRAFRSTTLAYSGSTSSPLEDVQRLRLLVDIPALRRADPLATFFTLQHLGEDPGAQEL